MNAFWKILGPKFCEKKGYIFIDKAEKLDEEENAMHDPTLCIINLDNSGSMSPGDPLERPNTDYGKAVAGAKVAV